jgi:hypothetical protein
MGVSGRRHVPAALYPRGKNPRTHWIGGWVGPRAGLDAEAKRKILCPCLGSNPGRPIRSQTQYWLNYPSSHYCNYYYYFILKNLLGLLSRPTHYAHVKFVGCNIKGSHRSLVSSLINNISWTTWFVGIFIIYLHAKLNISSSNGPLVIAVKLKVKLTFSQGRHVVILYSAKERCIFFKDLSPYIISGFCIMWH